MTPSHIERTFKYTIGVKIEGSSPEVARALYKAGRLYEAVYSPELVRESMPKGATNYYITNYWVIDDLQDRAEERRKGLERVLAKFPFVREVTVKKIASITTVLEEPGHV